MAFSRYSQSPAKLRGDSFYPCRVKGILDGGLSDLAVVARQRIRLEVRQVL